MSEAAFLSEAARQIPAVAVLVFVVIKFLSHIRESDRARERLESARIKALENLGSACYSFQESLAERHETLVSRVTTALDRNTDALGRATQAVDRFEDWLDNHESPATPPKRKATLRNPPPPVS